jgi:hypothetical protein
MVMMLVCWVKTNTVKKNMKTLLSANKEVGAEVNAANVLSL